MIPSSAAAFGWEKQDLDFPGCWRPQGGEVYSRIVRMKVHAVQTRLYKSIDEATSRRKWTTGRRSGLPGFGWRRGVCRDIWSQISSIVYVVVSGEWQLQTCDQPRTTKTLILPFLLSPFSFLSQRSFMNLNHRW